MIAPGVVKLVVGSRPYHGFTKRPAVPSVRTNNALGALNLKDLDNELKYRTYRYEVCYRAFL
jgi:hypothetical protein